MGALLVPYGRSWVFRTWVMLRLGRRGFDRKARNSGCVGGAKGNVCGGRAMRAWEASLGARGLLGPAVYRIEL